jgi:hypothetical protein
MAGRIFVAVDSFSCDVDGTPRVVPLGAIVREGHPIMNGREHLFEPLQQRVDFEVEQATAVPGELRKISSRPKGGRS